MKKVLIITYYWPPAGGPGVQRWLKFVKYLPEFGIDPIVYCPENPTYPIVDSNLISEIGPGVTVIKRRILEPYGLAALFSKNNLRKMSSGIIPSERKQTPVDRIALWIRGNIFIPDARFLWVTPSVAFLKKYITDHQIDTIITTGPPHSLHLIGLKLKNKFPDIKWVSDFRDPWTTIGYHKSLKLSGFAEIKHKNLEEKVLQEADQIIVTSKTTKFEFREWTAKPIHIITNGYDIKKQQNVVLDTKFSIAHIGSLLSQRNPKILWQVLSELVMTIPGFRENLQINLVGVVSREVIDRISFYKLTEFTEITGYVSHTEAVAFQQRSQVLLMVEINSPDTTCIIPGKLFEYMVSGRPIIAIGPQGSDFSDIISETNAGTFISYADKDLLKETILAYYGSYLQGNLHSNAEGIEKYSRRNLTGQLAELLK